MVHITEGLVRKKSEHNELMISTLEEISLHQEDIERIEHIQNWCRELKILLLQSNLISKIENLHKLKKLEYLNLAINNIERIENLEGLESLSKLDLTLNFIGDLRSVESLRPNYNLRELILTGNPCTDFPHYREYVIAVLPQLASLDGQEIKLSDKIQCANSLQSYIRQISQAEARYRLQRDEQKIRVQEQRLKLEERLKNIDDDQERAKVFWEAKSEHCPEVRKDMATQQRIGREPKSDERKQEKPQPKLFAPCGRPYNLNQPKLEFEFSDEAYSYKLNLHVFKYMDTSLIEAEVQPKYVRVTAKGKIFQLALAKEVQVDKSTSQRSQLTGDLLVVMPKLNCDEIYSFVKGDANSMSDTKSPGALRNANRELKGTVDYKNIVRGDPSPSEKTPNVDLSELPDLV